MNNKDFEHLIQEKLKDHETEVPVGLWESKKNCLVKKSFLYLYLSDTQQHVSLLPYALLPLICF